MTEDMRIKSIMTADTRVCCVCEKDNPRTQEEELNLVSLVMQECGYKQVPRLQQSLGKPGAMLKQELTFNTLFISSDGEFAVVRTERV